MSAVINRRTDPTDGLELVTGQEIALEATRHLFLAADLLDPARRNDIGLLRGGEELPNRCLRRTSGLLPRCEITPLEFWGEPLPLELFPDGVRPFRLKAAPKPENLGISNPNIQVGKPLYFMPLYPGDLIVDALGIASGEKRGIVEIKVLQGVDYGTADREMQELFFPASFTPPIELKTVRNRIEQVGEAHADPDVKSVAADMLLSCDQASDYMLEIVSVAQTQLQTRVQFQHTYRLTPKVRSFMAQLAIKPPADGMSALQDSVAAAVANSGISPELLDRIMAKQGEMIAAATANTIREVLAAQAVPTAPTEPTKD